MKVIDSGIDCEIVEKDCFVTLSTDSGIQVSMYGEIFNGKVRSEMTGPSLWNRVVYNKLSQNEQDEVIKATEKEISKFI